MLSLQFNPFYGIYFIYVIIKYSWSFFGKRKTKKFTQEATCLWSKNNVKFKRQQFKLKKKRGPLPPKSFSEFPHLIFPENSAHLQSFFFSLSLPSFPYNFYSVVSQTSVPGCDTWPAYILRLQADEVINTRSRGLAEVWSPCCRPSISSYIVGPPVTYTVGPLWDLFLSLCSGTRPQTIYSTFYC